MGLAVQTAFDSNRLRLDSQQEMRILPHRKTEIQTEGIVVAFGVSAAGPATLHKLIPALPKVFPPIALIQHMPGDFTGPFAKRLNQCATIAVKEAQKGDCLEPGLILLAPGDRHLRVIKKGRKWTAALDDGPKVAGFRPSVDVLFESVARVAGRMPSA